MPAVLGYGAGLAVLLGTFDYTGGTLRGYFRDPDFDEITRKENIRKNRRRPFEETVEEIGEGRGMLIASINWRGHKLTSLQESRGPATRTEDGRSLPRSTVLTSPTLSADKSTKQTFIKLVVLVGDVKDEDLGGQTGHWNLDIRSVPLSDNLNYSIVSFFMFYMRVSFVEKELRHLLDLVYEPSSSCPYSYLRRYVPIAINQYPLSITFS